MGFFFHKNNFLRDPTKKTIDSCKISSLFKKLTLGNEIGPRTSLISTPLCCEEIAFKMSNTRLCLQHAENMLQLMN